MKKIITIILALFILASCSTNNEQVKKQGNTVEKNEQNIQKQASENSLEDNIKETKIDFSTLEKNLEKLKNIKISSENLDLLNSEIINMYDQAIYEEALKEKNVEICKKAERNYVEECKKMIFIEKKDINSCDTLKEENAKIYCKNEILKANALEKLDEKLCDKLIFPKEGNIEWEEDKNVLENNFQKEEIQNCKITVLNTKALKEKNPNICKKIPIKEEQKNCIDFVKSETQLEN